VVQDLQLPKDVRTAKSVRPLVALGAVCGIAWAAGLRAFMVEIAGAGSAFDWWGTFAGILLPGAVTGALLAWAEAIRRRGGAPHWRWLATAPLALAIAPLLMPGALEALLTKGLGGGAVAVALVALGGGYALSGRGPLWGRAVCGAVSGLLAVGLVFSPPWIGGSRLALSQPRGAWVAVLMASLLVLLALASSIPHRGLPR
jgi:hypothetical protein